MDLLIHLGGCRPSAGVARGMGIPLSHEQWTQVPIKCPSMENLFQQYPQIQTRQSSCGGCLQSHDAQLRQVL